MESQVGYERLFDPQDIFFSTTDLKGVIQNTNRTFDTLSRYSRERLIGAPFYALFLLFYWAQCRFLPTKSWW